MKKLVQTLVLLVLAAASGSSELRIPLWVASPDDAVLLAKQDVQAWVDGEITPVLEVQVPGDPLILMIVMDTVGDLSRIDEARAAISSRIEGMSPEWRVALMQAQDGLVVAEDPTDDKAALVETLEALPNSGVPGLLNAIAPAASTAQSVLAQAHVRVAVLFVTDGSIEDYRGDYSAEVVNPSDRGDLSRRFRDRVIQERVSTLAASLSGYGAPLFFIHLNESEDELDVAYQNGIRRFADETAGEAYFVRSVSDVKAAVDQAWERIADHYSVHLEQPAGAGKAFQVRLESNRGFELRYRETIESNPGGSD